MEEEIRKLGNTELCKCFYLAHYKKYKAELDELYNLDEKDSRISNSEEYLKKLKEKVNVSDSELYSLLLAEVGKRGFTTGLYQRWKCIYTEEFYNWYLMMLDKPTYIREVRDTDYLGDMELDEEAFVLDYPVREAVLLLNKKGYETFWSSANIKDATERKGHVIRGKNVAYILIKPYNLSDDLKKSLLLDARRFWGIAHNYCDHGRYYGIWAEITSPDMLCSEISEILYQKANELPDLTKEDTTDETIDSNRQKKH